MSTIQRTKERFKYRNLAVMQGSILGNEKLVLITCAEFAHDDGTFYHGMRSLAAATGLGQGTVHRAVQSLLMSGVLKLLSKGTGLHNANHYQIVLEAIPIKPSVYDLVSQKNRSTGERFEDENELSPPPADPNRSTGEQFNQKRSTEEQSGGQPFHRGTEPFPRGTKDVDLDVDFLKGVDLLQDGDGSAASPPCSAPPLNLFEGQSQNPNPSQNQQRVNGKEVKVATTAKHGQDRPSWRPAFMDDAGESNPKPNGNGLHQSPVSADPPKLVNNDAGTDCKYCSQPWGRPHRKTCFHVIGRFV